MAAPTDRSPLTSLRQQLLAKRKDVVNAAYQVRLAESALAEAQRTGSADDENTARGDLTTAQDDLAARRGEESDLRDHLLAEIGHWLTDDQTKTPLSAADDLARLEANVPIILFPVRMETRFDPPLAPATANTPATTPTTLRVRIYPDEVFLNTHEAALTPEERRAGIEFYNQLNLSHEDDHRQRWRELIARFGPTRAAYIARVSTPPAEGQPDQRPNLATRGSAWTRSGEGVLPDRWVVIAYRGDQARPIVSPNPIREPLAMTPDPAETALIDVGDGMTVDKNLAWSLKFSEALAAGMAVEIPLQLPDEANGFDRLVVIGVKTSLGGDDTAALLEDLFDAHHYTRGIGIVPQGSPTNNTTDQPVRFPPDDPTGAVSFGFERAPVPGPGPAGASLDDGNFKDITTFFGVSDSVLRNIQNALGSEQDVALFMNAALWPVTLGYYLQQILRPMPPTDLMTETGQPTFSADTLRVAQFYFAKFVRARGSVSAFRLGNVPYGIIPALSLDRWIALGLDDGFSPDELLEKKMVGTLRILRNIWTTTASIPTFVGFPPTANQYEPLLRLLAQDANCKAVQLRPASGPFFNAVIRVFGGVDPAQSIAEFERSAQKVATGIGQNSWQPRGFAFTFNEAASDFREAFVSKELSDKPLDPDYITALADATMEQLRDDSIVTGDKPLLYLLLRHALLQQYLSNGLAVTPSTVPEKAGVPAEDPELWFTDAAAPNSPNVVTLFQFLGAAATDANGMPTTVFENAKKAPDMTGYLTLLKSKLAKLSTTELQLALTEALGLCSHRLDGWICALAVRRLLEVRHAQSSTPNTVRKPSFLGGYGWLENVRPASHPDHRSRERRWSDGSSTTQRWFHSRSVDEPCPDRRRAARRSTGRTSGRGQQIRHRSVVRTRPSRRAAGG